MKTIAHRLGYNNINLCVKLFPEQHLNQVLPIILFHYLLHHVHVLHFSLTLPVDHAVDPRGTGLHCEYRVEAVDAFGDVQDDFGGKKMLILHDGIVKGFIGHMVLDAIFEGLKGEEVDLFQISRELNILNGFKYYHLVLCLLFFDLFTLVFPAAVLVSDGRFLDHDYNKVTAN